MKPSLDADRVYIAHMVDCIGRVQTYCGGGESSFMQSQLIQDAVVRNLQTMAESSQRLSDPTKALAPDVPWRAISGFRNIIVHDYLGLDLAMVWQVVAAELPPLLAGLHKIQAVVQES